MDAAVRPRREGGIRAVLFDFGGVLADEGFADGLRALGEEQGLDVDLAAAGMDAVYDSGYVLGRGTERDFWSLLRSRTGLSGNDGELTRRLLDGFAVRPWMIDLVRALRTRGYVTGILSDQTDWLDALDRRHHFYGEFDHVFNSFHLGKGKRDPSLFVETAAALGLPPSQILFIDDNPGNLERAREAGMQTVLYTDREGLMAELKRRLDGAAPG